MTSGAQSTEVLINSYARWRSSRLGQITDALERQLLFELVGSVIGKTLLDVGRGDCELASEIVRRGAIATGLDADPAMIAAAQRRIEIASIQLQLIEARFERLPFDDRIFDRVVAVTVLCCVHDTERAIAEMARVLRPGGRLVIGELGYWSLWAAYRRLRGCLGNPTWQAATFRTAKKLRDLGRAAGRSTKLKYVGPCIIPHAGLQRGSLPRDLWLGQRSTFGSAFLAVSARGPMARDELR